MTDENSSKEDYAKYLSKGSAIVFSALIGSAIIGIVLRIFLARSLSPEDYGLLFAVMGFVSFFGAFRHLGLRPALTKFVSKFVAKDQLDDLKSTLLTSLSSWAPMAVSLSLVFIVLSGWLSNSYFGNPTARPVLIVLSVWGVATMTQNYLRKTFQAFQDMAGHSGIRVARLAFTLALVALAVFAFGAGIVGIAMAYLFGSIFSTILFYILLKMRHSAYLQGEGSFSKPLAKKLFSFGIPLLLSGIAGSVMGYTDTLMLTGFRNLESVGLYQVARPTTRILGYFGMAISVPFFPMVSEIWAKGEKDTLSSIISLLSKFSVVLIIPAFLVVLAFPDVVIRLLYGSEYLGAVNALRVLTVGTVFLVGSRILGPVLRGTEHPRDVMKSSGIAAILNAVANLVLIPSFGAGGAAIATSLSFFAIFVLRLYFSKGIVDFSIPFRSIFKALSCGGAALLLLIGLKEVIFLHPLLEALVVVVPVAFLYAVSVLRLEVVSRSDLDLINRATPLPGRLVDFVKRFVP